MTTRKTLQICRLLVAMLLFNMVIPALHATEQEQLGYTFMCTSAGLVKVSLDSIDDPNDSTVNPSSDHCPYCKLADLPFHFRADTLSYPAPSAHLALNYQSPLALLTSRYLLRHARLRAPPIYL